VGTVCAMPPVTPARISLPDRYRVVRHLANGGMASVWEAHDELLSRDVAVKVLASHLGEDERARRRFQREARAAAGLSSHPNVVTIYDVGEHKNRVFMVMEIMRGGTVGDRLRSGRDIPHETALRWLREAAAALDAADDAGVVHRDIKPANLLLDSHDRLAVADFGIARLAWEDQLTATGQVLGTAAYLSPEQAMGEAATAASDRYALAVVAYELLTGSRPFEAEHFAAQARAHVEDPPPPASTRAPELSRAVDAVLERGLAKDPEDRWPSASAFVDALERTLDEAAEPTKPTRRLRGGSAPPPPPKERPRRPEPAPTPSRRRGAPLLAGLAALILLAVVGAIALANRGDGGEEPRSQATPEATSEPTQEPTAEATATEEPTEEPTQEPTEEPTEEPTQEPTQEASGEPDLQAAQQLQIEGFNARRAGDFETALAKAEEALQACGGAQELSPCGYALFEKGAALNGLGRPEEAIPILEQRLNQYGDNERGEVERELRDARKKARKGD
jgi:eukaryotic-like serine/threonine-protein kinase